MNNPLKRTPKQPKPNNLHMDKRDIVRKHIEEPIGDWFTSGDRTISMTETNASGDVAAWYPKQDSISADMNIYTPNQLFELLQWEKLLRSVYYVPSDIWRKLNTGMMIGLIALLLFFAYLIFSNQTGGA